MFALKKRKNFIMEKFFAKDLILCKVLANVLQNGLYSQGLMKVVFLEYQAIRLIEQYSE